MVQRNRTLTLTEIRDCFPEGKEILRYQLAKTTRKINQVENFLLTVYNDENNSPDVQNFVTAYVHAFYLSSLTKQHNRIKRELAMHNGDFSNDLTKAKSIPLQQLFSPANPRQSGKRIMCKCPFHDEKQASFVIYLDSNSFHCFSCKSGGTTIDFIMKLNGCDLRSAIQYLNNL